MANWERWFLPGSQTASFPARLLAGGLLLNLFVFGLVAHSLYQSRLQYVDQATVSAASMSHMLAYQLGGSIRSIDLAMSAIGDEYTRQLSGGSVNGADLNRYVSRLHARLPYLDALRVADSRGIVAYGSDVPPGSQTSIADRPHFLRLRDDSDVGLVVSAPQKSRVNNKLVLVFARRIGGPGEPFGGMVFAPIAIEQLTNLFSGVDIGRYGSVSLRDANLRVLARYPVPADAEKTIGQPLAVPPLQAMIDEGHDVAAYTTDRTLDGVERTFSVRRIAGLPLYIVVGRSAGESLAPWRDQAARLLMLMVLFFAVTAVASLQIYRGWLRREAATAELARAEENLRLLNAQLEQRVIERTTLLEAANKELEEFSYSMSHDMRTPLRAIDGFSKILLEEHSAKLDDEGRRLLHVVRDNGRRMARLIDDILLFLHLGKRKMDCGPVDVGLLAREVFAELQAAAPQRRLRLDLDELPVAWGDRGMIRQAVLNLLSNAVKFSPGNEDVTIRLGSEAEEEENSYYVKDSGVGFDMRYANKLFKVFERVHPTGEYEGTAIGLAIVKRIVDRHGGRVWAEGKVGSGAIFHFTLPKMKE